MHAQLRGNEVVAFGTDPRLNDGSWDRNAPQKAPRRRAAAFDKVDYAVQIADSDASRGAAHQLVRDSYAKRGYRTPDFCPKSPHQTTIGVLAGCSVVATATLQLDSPLGVDADAVFKDQVDVYRQEGATVGEITRLAVARGVRSETVLAAVFHYLYIHGSHFRQCSHLFIEVNPRHRRFYETVFGFECLTPIRMNARVNAPAYLLYAETERLATQIFYPSDDPEFPRFYSTDEEQRIRATLANRYPLRHSIGESHADGADEFI